MTRSDELPLEGVKVIDCASVYAGPLAATILGDFGADVIKIEHPEHGDNLRHLGDYEEHLHWTVIGRNKRSLGLDLHTEEGQEILKELVEEADVLIENFRPGTLESWGLGWETLSEVNPDLVMVRTTGFGQTGPYKDRPGFGTLAESMSGFADLTGQADGPPTLPPFALADAFAGAYSTFAIMFALYWRDVNGGEGQYIDTSILEPMFTALMYPHVIEYSVKGIVRERMGNRIPSTAPRNTYKTKDDRWVAITASAESIAKRVLRIVGGEELENDPRFETMEARLENVEELDAIIQDWMSEHTREEVLDIFEEYEAAIAPVYNIRDIFQDEHFRERDALVTVEDEELGEVEIPGIFPKLSKTPGRVKHTGPALGSHAQEILLEETSLTEEEILNLAADGTITLNE